MWYNVLLWLSFHYFLLFLFYSSYLLPFVTLLPLLPALFPFLFEFWTCWVQGRLFIDHSKEAASEVPHKHMACATQFSILFQLYIRTQVCFFGKMYGTFFHCMFQAWLPSFQVSLFLWVFIFSLYKVSSSICLFL